LTWICAAASPANGPRPPSFEIASETAFAAFGHKIAADGDVVVALDVSATDHWSQVTRIFRATGGRVVEEANLVRGRGDWVIALDVSNERLVTQLDSRELVFYEHHGRWAEVQTLPLAGRCRESFQFLDLADTVLVIGAIEAICVYELRRGRWALTAELPIVSGLDEPLTNGDRIAQRTVRPEGVRLSRRSAGAWTMERELVVPAERTVMDIAISKRWLAVTLADAFTFDRPEIQLYALGASVLPVAVLRPQRADRQFGWNMAVTDDRLLTVGQTHQVFRFATGSWDPDGELAALRPESSHAPALGSVAWVGEVPPFGEGQPGTIFGYRLDQPR
jgi:hypothetical protein